MAAYKDTERGTWYVSFHYYDWTGKNKRKLKRGFKTRKEALEWEQHFRMKEAADLDMSFEDFVQAYTRDMQPKLKENTWNTKETIIRNKLLPYFKDKKMKDINPADIIQWQNIMIGIKNKDGTPLKPTYLKTIQSELSALFNHAVRFYDLKEYLSKTILSGVRPEELEILRLLLEQKSISINDFKRFVNEKYDRNITNNQVDYAIDVLQGKFVSNDNEYQKYKNIEVISNDHNNFITRMLCYEERLRHDEFRQMVEDIIRVGLTRYEDKFMKTDEIESPFVLYEKYSRRDVSLLMNCGKDLSSVMFGMKRIVDDVFIFVTYHKEKSDDERNYVDGKPDYADAFEDNMIFRWDSKIGMGIESNYMKEVTTAPRKHLLVKKSDAESNFYYMGTFDILDVEEDQKEDNKGILKKICKVVVKMHHPVRDDLLCYLQSTIKEN